MSRRYLAEGCRASLLRTGIPYAQVAIHSLGYRSTQPRLTVKPYEKDQRIAGKLVRAWIRGERLVFDEGWADERSTDGESIFATHECIASRAPIADQPTILLNTKQYQAQSNNGRTRHSVERALARLRVHVIECWPDYAGIYSSRDALLRTFYKQGLQAEDGALRQPREDWPEWHQASEPRSEAKVLEFKPRKL
jgi:hypothetical protein